MIMGHHGGAVPCTMMYVRPPCNLSSSGINMMQITPRPRNCIPQVVWNLSNIYKDKKLFLRYSAGQVKCIPYHLEK